MLYQEVEVRFLDVDKEKFVRQLVEFGAVDRGEELLEEVIIYDKERKWMQGNQVMRLRYSKHGTTLTYKEHKDTIRWHIGIRVCRFRSKTG